MRRCISFIVLLLITLNLEGQTIRDTIAINRLHLKGNVKSFKEFTYKCAEQIDGVIATSFEKETDFYEECHDYETNHAYYFDLKGKMIQSDSYDSPTRIAPSTVISYDQDRVTLVASTYHFSDVGTKTAKTVFKYNEKGLLVQSSLYAIMGTLASRTIYNYDSNGNLLKSIEYDNDGDIYEVSVYEYKYDDAGKITYKQRTTDSRYNEERTIDTEWRDSNGRLIHSKNLSAGILWDNSYYTYNDAGLLTRIINKRFGENGPYGKTEYSYDGDKLILVVETYPRWSITKKYNGAIIKTERYEDGKLKDKKTYVNERLTEIELPDGSTYTYEYKDDSKGNWIQAIERKNSIPTLMKKRTILYY